MVCSVGLLFAVAVGVVCQRGSSHIGGRLETKLLAEMVVVSFVLLVVKIQNKSSIVQWMVHVVTWLLQSVCKAQV